MLEISITVLVIPFAAYLLGSIPFGLLLAKAFGGTDVRKAGSGNIGATNVARVAGPLAGILTLGLDTAKGAAAVWLAGRATNESATWMMIAAFAVLLGHCFPVWLKFKGGKGVATALGVFLALCPLAAVSALLLFLLCVAYWRYVSLGSIAAAAAMPLLIYFLWAPRHAPPIIVNVGTLAIALLVIYKHDGNFQRLVEGTEPRFSFSKKKGNGMTKIAILGGGGWGTALAIVLSRSRKPHEISLWVHNAGLAESIRRDRENKTYLAGSKLPEGVRVHPQLEAPLSGAQVILGAMPSAHARAIYASALPFVASGASFVSASKGLEPSTHLRMSEVIAQVVSPKFALRLAVISGPSFAVEAASGEPTAVVLASRDAALAGELQEEFAGPNFRLYTNDDVLGVELAGAMKNVMAIAAGACQGLGLGSNALAALITRGLAEMARLAVALGARPETLSGLAGLGDLVLTCTGSLSRNRFVGVELGKGRPLSEILANMRMVAEGVNTAAPLLALAREHRIEMPITEQVDAILHAGKSPTDAIRDIMERPLKRE